MDLSWIATCVAALAGLAGTLTIAIRADRREQGREARQEAIDTARTQAEATSARRNVENEYVLRLSDVFLAARRSADRATNPFEPEPDFAEAFPESWEDSYYASMKDAEQVSDARTRYIFQDCIQGIYWCGGLEQQAGWGNAREIVRNTGAVGFVVAGFWLRGETIDSDASARAKSVKKMLASCEDFIDMQQDPDRRVTGKDPLTSPRQEPG